MDGFPTAIYLASEESVFHNQSVLFHLVRPTKTGDGVESAAGLANVIPRKRIYRMETVDELDLFKNELLRRPLVLQPTAESGHGLGTGYTGCGLWINKVNWVLLINQTHPKILGRIQMGVDAAIKAMEKGTPFLLRYKFGTLLQRMHYEIFQDGLRTDERLLDWAKAQFRFANWYHSDLVVRYPGKQGTSKRTPICDIQFSFEDLTAGDIVTKPHLPYAPMRPLNNPVQGDEIRSCLPEWTVNEITPLENIGETAPVNNYSYAQAGRLYESFRKKKKHRPGVDKGQRDNQGYDIELDQITPSVSTGAEAASSSNRAADYVPPQNSHVHGASSNYVPPRKHYNEPQNYDKHYDHLDRQPNRHMYPDVHVVDKSKTHDWYNKPDQSEYTSLHVNGRDSNQSSFSAGASSDPADSGYLGNDSDGNFSDKRNYDKNYSNKRNYDKNYDDTRNYDNNYNNAGARTYAAQENLGFNHENETDEILQNHKEYVRQMQIQNNPVKSVTRPPRSRDKNFNGAREKRYQNGHVQNYKGFQNGQSQDTHPASSHEYEQHNSNAPVKFGIESMSESFI